MGIFVSEMFGMTFFFLVSNFRKCFLSIMRILRLFVRYFLSPRQYALKLMDVHS